MNKKKLPFLPFQSLALSSIFSFHVQVFPLSASTSKQAQRALASTSFLGENNPKKGKTPTKYSI